MKAPAKAVQEKNPQRDGKIPFLCGFILYHMVQNNYRTAAEGKHVAAATRRRRRILFTGFFLPYRKVLRQKDIN